MPVLERHFRVVQERPELSCPRLLLGRILTFDTLHDQRHLPELGSGTRLHAGSLVCACHLHCVGKAARAHVTARPLQSQSLRASLSLVQSSLNATSRKVSAH